MGCRVQEANWQESEGLFKAVVDEDTTALERLLGEGKLDINMKNEEVSYECMSVYEKVFE
jgi:hypothetical protein